MYVYMYTYIIYTHVYTLYTYMNTTLYALFTQSDLSGQDLAASLPVCQHRRHWCLDVLPTTQMAEIGGGSTSRHIHWDLRPERHARVPQELHRAGNFHPWRCSYV